MRHDITDDSLKAFAKDAWLVHDYDFRLLIERIVYDGKPTSEDKYYLTSFFGEKYTAKILADVHYIRGFHKKVKNSDGEKSVAKKFVEYLNRSRERLVQDMIKKYETAIKQHEVLTELIIQNLHPLSRSSFK